ncbi:Hypothetical predicted protein [Cloeon dipterum]|uniref:DEP domain-containing protein n=1 Tax=Cloeon dipterum TaxID=197152 RepID=A0A8S1E059_9INSE|nr:Hypothetical predicted protein [Cloeon dipterum]
MHSSRWKTDAGNPFKATQKWNAAVDIFRVEMPVKSHRHFLRNHEDTFTGAEAATWFLAKLQGSNHFEYLSKNQVIALLDKFLKANVFEPVFNDKSNEFKPNNTLYQFPSRLPLRAVPIPNFATLPVPRVVSPVPLARSPMKRKSCSAESLTDPKHFLEDLKAQAAKRQKNALETEKVWETILFGRLEALFDGKDIQELIPPNFINGTWIAENANYDPPASIKEYFEKNKRDFPTWVQAAMKNLSNWPSISGFGGSHTYAGFEKDVLLEIVNYFKASEQPFISWELADIFRYAFIFLETQDCDLKSVSQDSLLSPTKSWTERLKSIDPIDYEDDSLSVEQEVPWKVRPASTNPFIGHTHESINMSQLAAYKLPPDTCFETAFTTESPTTRVVHTGTLKFNRLRDKQNRSRSSDNIFEQDSWHSVSHLEKGMSSLSVERSTNPFEPCHSRSHSGGYVNLGLSDSVEEEPPLEELNMSTALATIKVLAKKAKQGRKLEDQSLNCNTSVASTKTTASRATTVASGLMNAQNTKVAKKIYQLLLLLLPTDSRKKLCFLLHYLGGLVFNKDLKFCPEMTSKEFVVQSFCEFILGLPEGEVAGAVGINQFSKSLSCKVVTFLLDERDTVLHAPADLKQEVEQQLAKFQEKEKTLPRPLRVSHLRNSVRSVASLRASAATARATRPVSVAVDTELAKPVTFCRQVTSQQFEQQKCSGSQKALQELLETIIAHKKMKPKEKQKRLLTFKEAYPHIYIKRVPTKQDEDKILGLKKKASSFTKLNFLRI